MLFIVWRSNRSFVLIFLTIFKNIQSYFPLDIKIISKIDIFQTYSKIPELSK
jgi:hypothetical protein